MATVIIISIISDVSARKRRMDELKESFGKPPESDRDCEFDSISKYTQYMKDKSLRVDDITWNDLDMNKVFRRINVCLTSVGEEYLYNCLHELPLNPDKLQAREQLIRFFEKYPDKRLAVQSCLAGVGRDNFNGLPFLLFFGSHKMLKFHHVYNILALLPVLGALLFFVSISTGFFTVLGAFILNLIVYLRTKNQVDVEIPTIGYLTTVLKGVRRICKLKNLDDMPGMRELTRIFAVFKPAMRSAPSTKTGVGDMMDSFFQYINILFLYDIRKYNTFVKMIVRHKEDLHTLYRSVGEIDLALCVLSFRISLPIAAVPEFHDGNSMEFSDIFHPLINSPVTNSGKVDKPSLITGSNASGKSTFIKSLAVNGILAQTINTDAAREFKLRHSLIMTSMAIRDDIAGGDSYFIVEIKSLKRILDKIRTFPCICFIDEILRGTNTVERIAASTAVLEFIHTQDCICLAASHDIELTNILAGKYDNYHFREQVSDTGVAFDYLLRHGPSSTRNALKLLSFTEFDNNIVTRAEHLASEYDRNRAWLIE